MEKGRVNTQRRLGVGALILVMASLTLAVHVVVNLVGGYGYAREEQYYIACSEHLRAGYVDHPPFSIFVLALFRVLFGSSLFAIRLSAGQAGAAAVAFTGLLARELGGGRRAVSFACLATLVSPIHLGLTTIF
jgi:4-amino-4-deoxy-L-arabinose transferase-like glycosyltransferase